MSARSRSEQDVHVGVVAYEMEGRRSGVGRYLEGLLRGLREADPPGWRWTLFFQGEPFESELFGDDFEDARPVRAVFDRRPEARPIVWEQTRLPWILRDHDLDVLFSPAYSLPPFAGVPRLLTLHDLSFEHLPEEFAWRERWRRRHLARLAAARAERVLTDTATIARDVADTYDVDPARIGIVPLAVEPKFFDGLRLATQTPPEGLAGLGVSQPYLLHLGSLLPRRRIGLVLEAFQRLVRAGSDLQLVVAGADRLPDPEDLGRRVARLGLEERVRRLEWVPEELLVPLYAHATASIYVSTYEGYGLPPLESLAAGTPAVVSAGLALDDLWPDYPYRVELTADAVAGGLRRALDESRPAAFAARARSVVGRLDWTDSARALVREIDLARNTA